MKRSRKSTKPLHLDKDFPRQNVVTRTDTNDEVGLKSDSISKSLNSTFKGVRYMLVQQLLSRGMTFSMNMFLIRRSPVEMIGIVDKLDLLMATVLFLSRESIRMALLRNTSTESIIHKNQSKKLDSVHLQHSTDDGIQNQLAFNMSVIPLIGASMFVGGCILYDSANWFLFGASISVAKYMYLVAALIELIAEPSFILLQRGLLYAERVKTEGAAFLLQCLTTMVLFLFLTRSSKDNTISVVDGVWAHACAQIVFASVLLVGYTSYAHHTRLMPFRTFRMVGINQGSPKVFLDPYYANIAMTFFFQGVVKHLLTVGDRLVLVATGVGNASQGTYRLVSDLGSLVARIVFQPIEEASRAFFSKNLTNPSAADISKTLCESFEYLQSVIQLHIILGGFFVFLAPNYTHILLQLYNKFDPTTSFVLGVYCIYVPIMGINGILEAFFQGVGEEAAVRRQSYYMLWFWAVFVSTSYILISIVQMGTVGLIVSNAINMSMRIIFCFVFIQHFFQLNNSIGVLLPLKERNKLSCTFQEMLSPIALIPARMSVWILFGLSWFATYWSSFAYLIWGKLFGTLIHVAVGVICGIALLVAL
ncbi:hypothetical protein BDV3_001647 [Batrachochytrium dendrobatidis]